MLLPLGLILAVAGCTAFDGDSEQVVDCPSVMMLESARTLTRFAPEGSPTPSDVQLEVRLDGAQPTLCQREASQAVVEMQVRFSLSRGPASGDRDESFGYFVAISDPDSRIIAREGFNLSVDLSQDRSQAAAVDNVVTTIPLPAGARLEDYRLIVGLQLTREELEYNRRMLGR